MDFKKLSLAMLASVVMVPQMVAQVGSRVNVTHNVAVGEIITSSGDAIIQAKVGTIGTNPSTWQDTTISDSIGSTNNYYPQLFTDTAGDSLVTWIYIDGNGVAQLCMAVLLAGETTWSVANVSQSVGSAYFADSKVSVNQNGDALVVWSTQDLITGYTVILGSTTNIYVTNFEWSAPFVIAQP